MQTINNHKKKYSQSLMVKEIQIRSTRRFHLMTNKLEKGTVDVRGAGSRQAHSHSVDRAVNWSNPCGKELEVTEMSTI